MQPSVHGLWPHNCHRPHGWWFGERDDFDSLHQCSPGFAEISAAARQQGGEIAEIRLGYVDSEFGQLHFAACGSGAAVLMLHQTPRSWDEFLEVLPLIGRRRRAIAMDMVGFGQSANLPPPQSVEQYAAG